MDGEVAFGPELPQRAENDGNELVDYAVLRDAAGAASDRTPGLEAFTAHPPE
jgi:hypothetical protein